MTMAPLDRINGAPRTSPAPTALPATVTPSVDAPAASFGSDAVILSGTDTPPASTPPQADPLAARREQTFDLLRHLPSENPLKIYLVHGSHTGGHRAAAEAVEKSLGAMPNVHAEVIDALDYTGTAAKGAQVAATNFAINQASAVRGWAFRKSFEGNPIVYWAANLGMKMKAWMSRSFLTRIQQEKPDAILSCHSPMNSMLGYWKEQGKIDAPLHSVVTDYRAHRMWAQDGVDHYYLASEQVKQDLEKFGVASEKLEIAGIPIDAKFAEPLPSKEDARRDLGLDPEKPVVLMMGGSLGLGRFSDVARALDQVETPVQMVCITGKNEAKKKELEELQGQLHMPMTVLGYTRDVDRYMDASDVILSKPGGLTTSEIFAKQVPMVILDPMAGLEQMLVSSIVGTGGAVQVDGPEAAAHEAEVLIADPKRRSEVAENLARVAHPRAAEEVALSLVEAALEKRGLLPYA